MEPNQNGNGLARASNQSGSYYNSRSKNNSNEQQRDSETVNSLPTSVSRAREALAPLDLTEKQKREAWDAWKENPDGTERLAYRVRSAMRPAGVFLSLIRKGKHREEQLEPVRYTGWRFVHGSHGGTYRRDPKGRDILPPGYDLTPEHEPVRYSESEPDDVGMSADERLANLRRASELAARIGRGL